jgi:hypothetical protein
MGVIMQEATPYLCRSRGIHVRCIQPVEAAAVDPVFLASESATVAPVRSRFGSVSDATDFAQRVEFREKCNECSKIREWNACNGCTFVSCIARSPTVR